MIIKWREGETVHEFEWSGAPRTQEGRWIKERTGWSTRKFLDALEDLDPDAVIALIITLAARDGRKIKWDDVDIDPVSDLEFIPTEDEARKVREVEAAQAAADSGKGSLPPSPELRLIEDGPRSTGATPNGLLSVAASTPNAGPTLRSSGTVSD